MRQKIGIILLTMGLVIAFTIVGSADSIKLIDRKVIEGIVFAVSENHLGFKNGVYGYFPWASIEWVETSDDDMLAKIREYAPEKLTSHAEPMQDHHPKKGFSIKFPETWERKENYLGMTIIALSPLDSPTDDFRENINVIVEEIPPPVTLEEYFLSSLTILRKLLTDFEEHEDGQVTIDNHEAEWLIYSHRMGTVNLKVLQYIMVRNPRAYVITCSAAPDTFAQYQAKFKAIAQTFRFE